MRLAVIPARGGSKRIPGKNIKQFCGKPMIAWSIEAALRSKCFDKVVVSTDDPKIAQISAQYGAEVPFMRPDELSDDYTGTTPVIQHAIKWHQQNGLSPDNVCCVYATAPFISPMDLSKGLEILERQKVEYVFSATTYPFPIQRAIRLDSNGRVEMLNPDHFTTRSQDLEELYHDAGQFYWGRADAWLNERIIFSKTSKVILLPSHRVQDIDTQEDWYRAEWMFKSMQAETNSY